MSVTMSKANGVTVLSMNSDPQSVCPPLCQILKRLCYSPVCCSSSQNLRRIQRTSQSALGALQILVGLFSMGLAAVLASGSYGYYYIWWYYNRMLFPYWLGGLFILFGIVSVLSERFPSPCLVVINVILNLAGVAFAITAIVLYSINMSFIHIDGLCNYYNYNYNRYRSRHWYRYQMMTTATPSPEVPIMKQRCLEGQELINMLLTGVDAALIVLSVLELCLTISSAVLAIKALKASGKGDNKNTAGPEFNKPHLEEVTMNPAV